MPLESIADGIGDRMLSPTDTAGPQLEAPNIKNVQGDLVSLSPLAQKIFSRDRDIFEPQSPGRGTFDSHLFLLRPNLDSWKISFHDEGTEVFSIDLGKDNEKVSKSCICNPHFFAVKNPVFFIWT